MNTLSQRPKPGSTSYVLPFWLGLFLFSIYLLSFSGKFHVMDELAVFTAGHNLAQHRRADIDQLIWTNHWTPNPPGVWGEDGHLYTKKAPGISFMAIPLIWLGHAVPGLNAVHVGLLTNTIVTALTAALLFFWLSDLGFSRRAATLTTLIYGLGTIAWVYARMFWESSLLALFFLAAVWAAYRATEPRSASRRYLWLLLSGLAVAVGLTLRFEAIVAFFLIGFYFWWQELNSANQPSANRASFWRKFTASLPRLVIYTLPTLLVALGLVWFNFARFGSLTETGYTQELLFRAPWVGGFGLLFSPGRGLFIFSPVMLLLFFGLRPAWRRLPRAYFGLIGAMCLFYWLFYGSWFAWGGTWGWGPRFLLPILPLLMLFIAEPLAWASQPLTKAEGVDNDPADRRAWRILARLGIGVLVLLSLGANFLGIAVDLNEHFLRLGRNDDFVFNWAAMPLLGHWRILQEGLVDLIWLRPQPHGLVIEWSVLAPALFLFGVVTVGLIAAYSHYVARFIRHPLTTIFTLILVVVLTFVMMRATALTAMQNDEQAQADWSVLQTISAAARPGDSLHIPMPPFGDVQEITTFVMAYLAEPLPTYGWIETEPRAMRPDERARVRRATQADARRVWLFERWLTTVDPLSLTSAHFGQEAFPIREEWFTQSGKLTLYALADEAKSMPAVPLNIPFEGGLTLVDFAIESDTVAPGDVLKVRLTWQAPAVDQAATAALPDGAIISFVHVLDEAAGGKVAQQDRLLLDLQSLARSPLLPGQTVAQGYGLPIPADLPPGSYVLIAGLYSTSTGQRLPRLDGSPDDFIYLRDIAVK